MNQVAVVIGGGQTLGEFLCRGLAAEGYRVFRAEDRLQYSAEVGHAAS